MSHKVRKIFVMRHAESLEDLDKTAYEKTPDDEMPLTEKGRDQAKKCGKKFNLNLRSANNLRIILSPCKRVLETAEVIVSGLPKRIQWSLTTNSLIAKENWGDVTMENRALIEKERYRVGVLRYKFPGGESGEEMLFRFDLFVKKLEVELEKDPDEIFLIITHGFGVRVLLKSLLGWSEEYFEKLAHPHHCEIKRVAYHHNLFHLLDEMRVYDHSSNPDFIRREVSGS